MIYTNLSIDEIFCKIKEKYTEQEMQYYAYNVVSGIAENMDDFEEDTDFVAYLAEYFTTEEYREWLCETFLDDEDEVVIETHCGTMTCKNKWDCDLGNIIDIYDEDDEWVGFICGNLYNYTEERLIADVEDELENHWSEVIMVVND